MTEDCCEDVRAQSDDGPVSAANMPFAESWSCSVAAPALGWDSWGHGYEIGASA